MTTSAREVRRENEEHQELKAHLYANPTKVSLIRSSVALSETIAEPSIQKLQKKIETILTKFDAIRALDKQRYPQHFRVGRLIEHRCFRPKTDKPTTKTLVCQQKEALSRKEDYDKTHEVFPLQHEK
nr:unnamed protein product [Spirometra erinaceieuropaei]